MSLYDRLRGRSTTGGENREESRDYGFYRGSSNTQNTTSGGTSARFKVRSSESTNSRRSPRKPGRQDDADRPAAYSPPAVREEAQAQVWVPPTVGEILRDLGLRMLEVAIGAAAQEIAYFFTKRRFHTGKRGR